VKVPHFNTAAVIIMHTNYGDPHDGSIEPDGRDWIKNVNRALSAACRDQGVAFFRTLEVLADERGLLAKEYDSGDGVHLSKEGYRAVGTHITDTFSKRYGPGPRIACLGDSLTYGYVTNSFGSYKADAHPEFLAMAGYESLNLGICGDTTGGMLARLSPQLIKKCMGPTHCIVLGGANDLFMQVPRGRVVDNLLEIAGRCREHGMGPVILELYPWG